jgi:hypothetical protein
MGSPALIGLAAIQPVVESAFLPRPFAARVPPVTAVSPEVAARDLAVAPTVPGPFLVLAAPAICPVIGAALSARTFPPQVPVPAPRLCDLVTFGLAGTSLLARLPAFRVS